MERRYYVASDDTGEDSLHGPFTLAEARKLAEGYHWGNYGKGPAMVLRKVADDEEEK